MDTFIARVKVIASAAVTALTLVMAVLLTLSEQIGELIPGSTGEMIATWLVRVIAWLGTAIAVIRRVTPVADTERGILPS